jgi:hypothetical protein
VPNLIAASLVAKGIQLAAVDAFHMSVREQGIDVIAVDRLQTRVCAADQGQIALFVELSRPE